MKYRIVLLLFLMMASYGLLVAQIGTNSTLTFLHTSGQNIVNESGEKIYLKGVGLGNWLLPEGYMWKFGNLGDRPRKIEKLIADLIGEEKAAIFWRTFRQNYISEADIKRIAELGFNAVRPALNARLILSEGERQAYLDTGFQYIDSLISWCKKYDLYVIIDMHAAPGGQTGANIDDSQNNLPELFTEKKYQDQLTELWVKIAERYKNEAAVAAYDLLNEPLPANSGSAGKYKHLLEPLYQRITTAIRAVDQRHMITLEGFNWANDWSLFKKPFDNNVFYQFHYYCWNRPDNLNSIEDYLIKRKELNTPIWVGETREKNNAIHWATTQLLEAKNIGFSFWPWKKMDTRNNTPYSIKEPGNWNLVVDYSKGGPKPGRSESEAILDEFLNNCRLENCVYAEDVCNAILTRIPAKIEAENYGPYGYNNSYFVIDTARKSKYYRRNEPVKINLDSRDKEQFSSGQSIELQQSEWVVFTFDNLVEKKYDISVRASATAGPSQFVMIVNKEKSTLRTLSNAAFNEVVMGSYKLRKGKNTIKILVKTGILNVDWIGCN